MQSAVQDNGLGLMAQAIRKPPRRAVFAANAISPLCIEGRFCWGRTWFALISCAMHSERTGAVAGPEAYGDRADGIERAKRTWIGKDIVVQCAYEKKSGLRQPVPVLDAGA